MKDFGEPWEKDGNSIVDKKNDLMLWRDPDGYDNMVALDDDEMDRIVACVNGCAGIEHPENIPEIMKAIEDFTTKFDLNHAIACVNACAGIPNPGAVKWLIRALGLIASTPMTYDCAVDIARNALAKMREEEK